MPDLISLEVVAHLERDYPSHGVKAIGLRIAENAGLAVPAYFVVSGEMGSDDIRRTLVTADLPLIVRNSPNLPWTQSDEVSGSGVSVVCQTTTEVESALAGRVAPSGSSSAVIQRYVSPTVAGFIHQFPRGLFLEAGREAIGVVCWTHGTGAPIAFGADDPSHFVVAASPDGALTVIAADADIGELEQVNPVLRAALCSIINLLGTDVPLELEWVWDGDRLWIVQLQPLDLEHSHWPYLSRSDDE